MIRLFPLLLSPEIRACPWGFPSLHPTSSPLTSPRFNFQNSSLVRQLLSYASPCSWPHHFSPGFLQQLSNQSPHLHGFPLCLRWLYNFSSKPSHFPLRKRALLMIIHGWQEWTEIVLGKREHVFTPPLSLAYKLYSGLVSSPLKFFHGFPFP